MVAIYFALHAKMDCIVQCGCFDSGEDGQLELRVFAPNVLRRQTAYGAVNGKSQTNIGVHHIVIGWSMNVRPANVPCDGTASALTNAYAVSVYSRQK
jgi:hypothetical protein